MNEKVWHEIFKDYVACYEAIETLTKHSIFDEEEKEVHEHNLLHAIIETMRSEVEE